jgi:hypothetical protein
LINNPLSAPIPEPTKIAVGASNPNAQGQAITHAALAKFKLYNKGAFKLKRYEIYLYIISVINCILFRYFWN